MNKSVKIALNDMKNEKDTTILLKSRDDLLKLQYSVDRTIKELDQSINNRIDFKNTLEKELVEMFKNPQDFYESIKAFLARYETISKEKSIRCLKTMILDADPETTIMAMRVVIYENYRIGFDGRNDLLASAIKSPHMLVRQYALKGLKFTFYQPENLELLYNIRNTGKMKDLETDLNSAIEFLEEKKREHEELEKLGYW